MLDNLKNGPNYVNIKLTFKQDAENRPQYVSITLPNLSHKLKLNKMLKNLTIKEMYVIKKFPGLNTNHELSEMLTYLKSSTQCAFPAETTGSTRPRGKSLRLLVPVF